MKRPILLILLTLMVLALFAVAADHVQARLEVARGIGRPEQELPREWVWRRKAIAIDDMVRERFDRDRW